MTNRETKRLFPLLESLHVIHIDPKITAVLPHVTKPASSIRVTPRSTRPCHACISKTTRCRPRHGNKRGGFPTHKILCYPIIVALLPDPGDHQRVSCDPLLHMHIIQTFRAPLFALTARTRTARRSLPAAFPGTCKSASGRDALVAS